MKSKSLSALLALLPLAGMAIYLFVFIRLMTVVFSHQDDPEAINGFMMQHMSTLIGAGFLLFILTVGALVYFIIHVVNNKNVEGTERIIWILVFVFAGVIAFPVYWIIRIRPVPTGAP